MFSLSFTEQISEKLLEQRDARDGLATDTDARRRDRAGIIAHPVLRECLASLARCRVFERWIAIAIAAGADHWETERAAQVQMTRLRSPRSKDS